MRSYFVREDDVPWHPVIEILVTAESRHFCDTCAEAFLADGGTGTLQKACDCAELDGSLRCDLCDATIDY